MNNEHSNLKKFGAENADSNSQNPEIEVLQGTTSRSIEKMREAAEKSEATLPGVNKK